MGDNSSIYNLSAAVYELSQDGGIHVVCPVLDDNDKARQIAHEWASSLARITGQKTTIHRNGALQITIPGRN